MLVHMFERSLYLTEELVIIDWFLGSPLNCGLLFQFLIKVYLGIGQGKLISYVNFVKLLALGVKVILVN